jgi:hypothetical protein
LFVLLTHRLAGAVPDVARTRARVSGTAATAGPAPSLLPAGDADTKKGRKHETTVPEQFRGMWRFARHNRVRELQEVRPMRAPRDRHG